MARRRLPADVLIALGAAIEMQAELLLVDAPRRDVLSARAALLVLAFAVLLRRRLPIVAAALGIGAIVVVETLGEDVNANLVGRSS